MTATAGRSFSVFDTTLVSIKSKVDLSNSDSSDRMSEWLLSSHPMFTDHWINDVTFVYEDVTYDDIPDEVFIPLLEGNSLYKLTWYGKVNSTYKRRWGRYHQGLDLHLKTGDDVFAAFDGVVRYAQYNKSGYGNCVIIRHLNGLETVYGHLSKIQVKPNEYVKAGDVIGLGGSTGHSFGPHLHFETRYKDFSFDPELIFDCSNQEIKTENLVLEKKQFLAYHYHASRRSYKTRKSTEETLPEIADSTDQPIDLIEVVSGDESVAATNKYYPAPEKTTVKVSAPSKKVTVTGNTKRPKTISKTTKKTATKNKKAASAKSTAKKGAAKKSANTKKKKNTVAPKKKTVKKTSATPAKQKGKKANTVNTAKKGKKKK